MTNIKDKEQEGLKSIQIINDVLAELIQCLIDDDKEALSMLEYRLKRLDDTNYTHERPILRSILTIVIATLCMVFLILITI